MENWRPIPNFEDVYEVSDLGRVRSLDRILTVRGRWGLMDRLFPGRILGQVKHLGGYRQVHLYENGVRTPLTVHSCVLEAFVGPRLSGMYARHLNGVRHDNRLANLAWGTWEENDADKELHGTRLRGERCAGAILDEGAVREIRRRRGEPQADLAAEFGCTFSNISAIQRGKSWRHVES